MRHPVSRRLGLGFEFELGYLLLESMHLNFQECCFELLTLHPDLLEATEVAIKRLVDGALMELR